MISGQMGDGNWWVSYGGESGIGGGGIKKEWQRMGWRVGG